VKYFENFLAFFFLTTFGLSERLPNLHIFLAFDVKKNLSLGALMFLANDTIIANFSLDCLPVNFTTLPFESCWASFVTIPFH